ncbi:MAG: response regulator transcription factor [Burkholderiaceae bacterium]
MRICLVEDDLLLGRALAAWLGDAGHRVVWVRMARDAELNLAGETFDAVVLDLGLPDGDGLTLLRRLRAGGDGIAVVVITARGQLDERLDGLDAGADDYLVKPFDVEELGARLRAVVRRGQHEGGSADVLQVGGVRLDEARMLTFVDGQQVSLSPTEFGLLRELLRNRNRVRTRRQLEAGAMPDSDGQALDVHMSNLRRKIGAGVVRTVRGVGYVIDDPPVRRR